MSHSQFIKHPSSSASKTRVRHVHASDQRERILSFERQLESGSRAMPLLCPLGYPAARPLVCPPRARRGRRDGRTSNVWARHVSPMPGAAWVAKDARLLRRSALGFYGVAGVNWSSRCCRCSHSTSLPLCVAPCRFRPHHKSQGHSSLATLADQNQRRLQWPSDRRSNVGRRSILADRISCPNAGQWHDQWHGQWQGHTRFELPLGNAPLSLCAGHLLVGAGIQFAGRIPSCRPHPEDIDVSWPDCRSEFDIGNHPRFPRSHTVRRTATIFQPAHLWWSGPPDSG